MGRGRAVGLIASAILVVALVAAGARYFWARHERQQAELTVAALRRTAREARALLAEVTETRTTVDTNLDLVKLNDAQLRAQAAALHADLDQTKAGTATTSVSAYLTASQANNLSQCLIGVSQALNQLSVGDGRALASLRAVDAPLPRRGSRMTSGRKRALLGTGAAVLVGVLIAATMSGISEQRRLDRAQAAEAAQRALIQSTRESTAGQRAAIESAYLAAVKLTTSIAVHNVDISATFVELGAAKAALANAQAVLAASTGRRDFVQQCLVGVRQALDATGNRNTRRRDAVPAECSGCVRSRAHSRGRGATRARVRLPRSVRVAHRGWLHRVRNERGRWRGAEGTELEPRALGARRRRAHRAPVVGGPRRDLGTRRDSAG